MEIQKQNNEQFKIEIPNFGNSRQKCYVERLLLTRGIPEDTRKRLGQWYNTQTKHLELNELENKHYMVANGEEIYALIEIDSTKVKTATFSVLTMIDGISRGYDLQGYLAALDILGKSSEIEKVVTKIKEDDEHTIKTLKFLGFEDNGTGCFLLDREPEYKMHDVYKKHM